MAAPTWPTIDEGQWNLVAQNVVAGTIDRLKSQYKFWVTYVLTGAAAPVAGIKEKSPEMFQDGNQDEISSQESIDVYIWPENADTETDETNIANAIQVNI